MRIDWYTKVVLTVIAIALSAISTRQLVATADAQSPSCGRLNSPCAVVNVYKDRYGDWKPCYEGERGCYLVGTLK